MGKSRVPTAVAVIVTMLLIVAMVWLRLVVAWRFVLPVGYGVPLVIVASFRRRSLLWAAVGAFLVLSVSKYFIALPKSLGPTPILTGADYRFANFMVAADLLVVGAVAHLWIRNQDRAERHAVQLEIANAELLARETQLAQRNDELKSQSSKLEGQSAELRQVIGELDIRRREAEEASVRKTRFLAAVSHDIRTPANAIGLLAELVRRSASDPATAAEVPELAGELHASAVALIGLLGDVLDLARFDSGRIELQNTVFGLNELVSDLHRQMLPLAREKHLDFSWGGSPHPIELRADRIKLARILGNLIGNAIKFTQAGTVRVEVDEPTEEGVVIRVIDSGIGIAPEFQRHIFDEFFQIRNPERDRNKGTGLGLTICQRLTDAIGGVLKVSSSGKSGSTFTVKLPAHLIVQQPAQSESASV